MAKRDAGNELLFCPENCQNISTANAKIWMFLKNFKCKGSILTSSLDSVLSSASRDVVTASLAQFFQTLWLIKPRQIKRWPAQGYDF